MTELIKRNDIWGIYWVKEIISVAKRKNLKYAQIWAVNYYHYLDNQSPFMSTELIEQEMDNYYLTKVLNK